MPEFPSENKSPLGIKAQQGVILAIEDDLQDVEILRIALAQRNSGWKVLSVPFAREAMLYLGKIGQYADENQFPRPEIIVLDLALPGMSGMEVSRRILKVRPDIPVLLTTGHVRQGDIEQARAIGIREVIWKPQTVAEMGDLLALQLEKLVPTRT